MKIVIDIPEIVWLSIRVMKIALKNKTVKEVKAVAVFRKNGIDFFVAKNIESSVVMIKGSDGVYREPKASEERITKETTYFNLYHTKTGRCIHSVHNETSGATLNAF